MATPARIVVLLRGVNVGGRKLPMNALRSGLEEAGCADVVTYIQSGNVVLAPPAGRKPAQLRPWFESTISSIAGYEVGVVLRTAAELRHTVEHNPFPDAGGTALHVVF